MRRQIQTSDSRSARRTSCIADGRAANWLGMAFAEVRSLRSEVRFSVSAGVGFAGDKDGGATGLLTALGEGEKDAVDGRVRRENS